MKYLKIFNNDSEYELFKSSDSYVTPNICYIKANKNIKCEPKISTGRTFFVKNTATNVTYEFTFPAGYTNFHEYFYEKQNDWIPANNATGIYVGTNTGGITLVDGSHYNIDGLRYGDGDHPISNYTYTCSTNSSAEPISL